MLTLIFVRCVWHSSSSFVSGCVRLSRGLSVVLDNCLNGEDAVSVSVGVSDEVGTAVVVGKGVH